MAITTPYDPLVLNQIDIGKKKGYLGSPLFDSKKSKYLDNKALFDEYRSKRLPLENDLKSFERRYKKMPYDSLLPIHINNIKLELDSLDNEYNSVKLLHKVSTYDYQKYAKLIIDESPSITDVILDRTTFRSLLFEYDSPTFTILNKNIDSEINELSELNSLIGSSERDLSKNDESRFRELEGIILESTELKEWLKDFMPNYDPASKSFPPNFLPETFKEYLEYTFYHKIGSDFEKYGLKKAPYPFYNKKTRMHYIKLEFLSGLKIEIKKHTSYRDKRINPPYSRFDLNVIEIGNNLDYNLVLKQNNYKALTKCFNIIIPELRSFYKILFPKGESPKPYDMTIRRLLNFDTQLNFQFSRLLVDYFEPHINLTFPNKRDLNGFDKTFGLIGLSMGKKYRNRDQTHYFDGHTKPETRCYNKTQEIYDTHNKLDIGYYVYRIESAPNTLTFMKKAFSSINYEDKSRKLYDSGYYHPDDPNGSHLTPEHTEKLFNQFIEKFFYKTCKFPKILDLIRYIKNNSDSNIIDVINSDDSLRLILESLYNPKSSSDLIYYTGLKKSTLDRRLAKIKGLVAYNHSTKKYELTVLGGLVLRCPLELLNFYYYFKKSLSLTNSISNSISHQTSISDYDISSFIYPILDYLLKLDKNSISGGDDSGT